MSSEHFDREESETNIELFLITNSLIQAFQSQFLELGVEVRNRISHSLVSDSKSMALSRLGLGLIIVFHAVISSECKYVMPFHRRKGRLGIEAPTLSSPLQT